jgi:hypothetical protein
MAQITKKDLEAVRILLENYRQGTEVPQLLTEEEYIARVGSMSILRARRLIVAARQNVTTAQLRLVRRQGGNDVA